MRIWIDTANVEGALGLFGLSPVERHLRALSKLKDRPGLVVLSGPTVRVPVHDGVAVEGRAEAGTTAERLARFLAEGEGPVMVLDGAAAVDPRLIAYLAEEGRSVVAFGGEGRERAAALRLNPDAAGQLGQGDGVLALADRLSASGVAAELMPEDFPSFITNLRRSLPFWLFAVPDETVKADREYWMFRSNYKGSTDFLTKWVYPPLVWQLVKLCTRYRIHPNTITILSTVLTFAAVPLFMYGHFWSGLAMAFAMTVLDSVDGKVARLTLTDSAFGNFLDHGLDIVHPPLWYLGWASGLIATRGADYALWTAGLWLVAFYVADRIVLGIAKARFKRGLHAVTSLDAAVRTWIARRNVNLVIFTAGLALDRPEAAFLVVVAWQGLTMAWHAGRTAWLIAKPPAEMAG